MWYPLFFAPAAHCRSEILHSNPIGAFVDGEEQRFLLQLFAHHPDLSKAAGVTAIRIDKSKEHPSRCFWVMRKDGSEDDISVRKCLAGLKRLPGITSCLRTNLDMHEKYVGSPGFDVYFPRYRSREEQDATVVTASFLYESCNGHGERSRLQFVFMFF